MLSNQVVSMANTEMKQFSTIDEMLEAKAQENHQNNLNYGGVFDKNGNRYSDIDIERKVVKDRGTTFIGAKYVKLTLGFESKHDIRYIRNFGYVEMV